MVSTEDIEKAGTRLFLFRKENVMGRKFTDHRDKQVSFRFTTAWGYTTIRTFPKTLAKKWEKEGGGKIIKER